MSSKADSFYKLASSRRSIRRFNNAPVAEAVIRRVLEAGIQAPSAHNRQPWRFVVLQEAKTSERLASRMGAVLRADLESDGLDAASIEADVSRSYARITGAAAAIVVCLDKSTIDEYPDEKRSTAEYIMGIQGVAMAGENILLAAQAEGLGGCWVCAPLFVPDLVREELDLQPDWEPQGMVLLGYPRDAGRVRSRRPVEEVTLWI